MVGGALAAIVVDVAAKAPPTKNQYKICEIILSDHRKVCFSLIRGITISTNCKIPLPDHNTCHLHPRYSRQLHLQS